MTRLSICECGFGAMNDGVALGKEYVLHGPPQDGFTWRCGGCGRSRRVSCVEASQTDGSFALLPVELFEEAA